MASFVFVCSVDGKGSSGVWRKTRYKQLNAWKRASGAVTHMRRRGVISQQCYRLPGGKLLKAAVLEEFEVRRQRVFDRALSKVLDYLKDKKAPVRWRAKALADALAQHGIRMSKS